MIISPKEACEKLNNENARLIDVRTPAEYRSIHAAGAENHELILLTSDYIKQEFLADASDTPLLLICKSGQRAPIAADKYKDENIPNVFIVEGGTDLWDKSGLAVVRGKSIMSLERQVRITAGTLVFIGTLLGGFINPYLLIIPGFVGAGLVFAGLTDSCAMGVLLSKMPWNK